jgi:hypothetical protein
MPQSLLELIFKTSKQGQGGKQAAAELKELKGTVAEVSSGMLGFNAANLTAAGAILAVGNYAKQSVEKFLAYGETIRELSSITGTGAEETSRLVQTMDDFGIATEKVGTIAEQAAKKGFLLTTETLADLADEYNSLETQEEKNALMTQRLGKAGLELNKVMEEGGDAIREMAAAQSENLILTEQEAAAAEQLRRNIDTATDTWEGYMLVVGGKLAEAYNKATEASEAHAASMERHRLKNKEGAAAQEEMNQKGRDLLAMTTPLTEGIAGYNGVLENTPGALKAVEDAQGGVNDVMKSYSDMLLFNIASEGLSAEAALSLATRMGLVDSATSTAYDSTAKWKKELENGKITIEEYDAKVLALQKTIAALQDREVNVTVNVRSNSNLGANMMPSGLTDYLPKPPGGANGADFVVPPGYANDSYLMAVSSGERVTVQNDRMRWTGEGGAGMNVTFTGAIVVDSEANYQKTLRRLSADITKAVRGGI